MYSTNEIKNRLGLLRTIMIKKSIDAFLITHDDEYLLESTPENHKRLNWLIGFSGSAGCLVITKKNLYLFVDSRYTLQAKMQTKGLKTTILNLNEVTSLNFFKDNSERIGNIALYTKALSFLKMLKPVFSKNSCL